MEQKKCCFLWGNVADYHRIGTGTTGASMVTDKQQMAADKCLWKVQEKEPIQNYKVKINFECDVIISFESNPEDISSISNKCNRDFWQDMNHLPHHPCLPIQLQKDQRCCSLAFFFFFLLHTRVGGTKSFEQTGYSLNKGNVPYQIQLLPLHKHLGPVEDWQHFLQVMPNLKSVA